MWQRTTQCNTNDTQKVFSYGGKCYPCLLTSFFIPCPQELLTYIHVPHAMTLVSSQATRVHEHVLILANTLVCLCMQTCCNCINLFYWELSIEYSCPQHVHTYKHTRAYAHTFIHVGQTTWLYNNDDSHSFSVSSRTECILCTCIPLNSSFISLLRHDDYYTPYIGTCSNEYSNVVSHRIGPLYIHRVPIVLSYASETNKEKRTKS